MFLKNILLAYQLENYKALRFLRFIYSHPRFWIHGSNRQELVWTKKAKALICLSLLFFLLDILGTLYLFGTSIITLFIFICVLFCFPLYFILAHFLLTPLDIYLKNKLIAQAKQRLQSLSKLKVIAITGSYGKTSTREIISTLLQEKYTVFTPEGNKNTPLGVSETIMKIPENTEGIFIVEMGAYTKGDIKELCLLTHPHISILTGITLQHLERFGSLENIQEAKFEILQTCPLELGILDITSSGAKEGYERLKSTIKSSRIELIEQVSPVTYLRDFTGIEFELEGQKYTTKLLAKHSVQTIEIAIKVATFLGLTQEQIQSGISKIGYVKHRMELLKNPNNNTYIIDDSYNGNLEGVESLIHLLSNVPFDGRKIIIPGGVVELGEKSAEVNTLIGEKFAQVSDLVLLANGPISEAIEKGLKKGGFPEANIKKYTSSLHIHKDLGNVIQPGDVVVFQNDLPDTYL